ncbi:MAG: glycosyltransferase family 4 protein [Acidobacteriota bacterium]
MTRAEPHPLKILEIETFGRGGLTHYTYNLSQALADRGHQVTMATAACYELEGDAVGNVEIVKTIGRASHRQSSGERTLPGPVASLLRKGEAIYDSLAVAALARRLRPDVIHLHCTNPIALAYLAALSRLRRPLVATAHVVTPHEPIPWQRAVYRRIHGLGDRVIAHSQFDRQRLLEEFGVDAGRVEVIPHGEYGFFERALDTTVDRAAARRRLGLQPGDEVALFFGYIREYKGLDILFDAWPRVAAARPSARLVVAGDPVRLGAERRDELERWADRLGAVHRFGYIPFSEVAQYFAAADLLVMPYRHISQSGVLYLALSLGVPVVATRVGALPEMLQDEDSALLVPPESPGELASALTRALGDPELRQHLAEGGREIATAHSWPSIAEQTERLFLGIVES